MPSVKRLAACGFVVLLLGLLWSPAGAGEPGEQSEPRLVLPGDHVVRAGQAICLRWDEADAITELEILLSLDGGRHYAVCISPQLDPARREFVWRVPPDVTGELRMRIRFNRGGREIEGAPSAPLVVAGAGGEPEPLGLPPVDTPQPAGRGGAPASGGAGGAFEAEEDGDALAGEPPVRPNLDVVAACAIHGAVDPLITPFVPPRSIPLRT